MMSRWVREDVYSTGVLLEQKQGLEMGRETHLNVKYLCVIL